MKNSNKKISVGILAGALLIGGVFSQGELSYASSIKSSSPYEISKPQSDLYISQPEKYLSNKYIKRGGDLFSYGILYRSSIDDSELNFIDKSNLGYAKFDKYFLSGENFIEHLYHSGMRKGVYDFWIANIHYRINILKDIEPIPSWKWWDGFSHINWWED